jgi:hypothetical protein
MKLCLCVIVCSVIKSLLCVYSGVNHVLLEDVPNCAKCTHLLPKQAHYSGTQEHKRWTHGSAELQGNRPNLSGVQARIVVFQEKNNCLKTLYFVRSKFQISVVGMMVCMLCLMVVQAQRPHLNWCKRLS